MIVPPAGQCYGTRIHIGWIAYPYRHILVNDINSLYPMSRMCRVQVYATCMQHTPFNIMISST